MSGARGSGRVIAATGLQVGGLVALVRVGVFWAAFWLYTGHADWRQVVGYAVLILDSILELTLAASLAGSRPGPPAPGDGIARAHELGVRVRVGVGSVSVADGAAFRLSCRR